MTEYSATPLSQKLGIRGAARVAIIGAPEAFVGLLQPLPRDVAVQTEDPAHADLVILFATAPAELEAAFGPIAHALPAHGAIWIAWPKKTAQVRSELTFGAVQSIGLATGLVDNKSCSIDECWQALRFVVRLTDRAGRR